MCWTALCSIISIRTISSITNLNSLLSSKYWWVVMAPFSVLLLQASNSCYGLGHSQGLLSRARGPGVHTLMWGEWFPGRLYSIIGISHHSYWVVLYLRNSWGLELLELVWWNTTWLPALVPWVSGQAETSWLELWLVDFRWKWNSVEKLKIRLSSWICVQSRNSMNKLRLSWAKLSSSWDWLNLNSILCRFG